MGSLLLPIQPSRSLLLGAAGLHALLMWAAFPPVNLWPLILLAPAPLAWVALRAPSTRFAVLTAIGAHVFLWAWISRWMIQVSEVGFPFYVLAMAAFNGGVFVWVFRRIHLRRSEHPAIDSTGTERQGRVPLLARLGEFDTSRLPMTVTLPVVWVALEALRGEIIMDGYPWYFLAHPLVELPVVAQSADLFGAYFISFIAAMVSGALLDLLRARETEGGSRCAVIGVVAVAILHAANLAYGAWRINQTEQLSDGPTMLVIQTNLPQDNKMRATPQQQADDLVSFLRLTIEAHDNVTMAGERVDVIVWPETMLPGFGLEIETIRYLQDRGHELPVDFAEAIVSVQRGLDVPMLVGSPAVLGLQLSEEPDGSLRWVWSRNYNSVYLIEGDPPFLRYDKSFLTPFGETMPYISRWPGLEQRLLALGARGMRFDLDQNPRLNLMPLEWEEGMVRLATPICFESTVSWLNRRMVYESGRKRADVLVNVTNDGWFGFHGPGRVQHAQISRYRAIENRVPVVRSANTGVSVSIDSAGRLVDVIGDGLYGEPMRADYLLATVTLDSRETLYGKIGNLWAGLAVACAAFLFGATWFPCRRLN